MCKIVINNVDVILPKTILAGQQVCCADGRIQYIRSADRISSVLQKTGSVIDATGCYLAPGYIDLHIHGLHHYLVDRGVEHIDSISRELPRYGVTGFLPTFCPKPTAQELDFLHTVSGFQSRGAQVFAFHMEGPFISLGGALTLEKKTVANGRLATAMIASAQPYKIIFSISPEFPGILPLIPLMAENHTPVFMTHTRATVNQCQMAFQAGVSHATHFYDVFPLPDETDPGVRPCGAVEAVLSNSNVTVDFILDGEHVDPVAVNLAWLCKGPDGVCLISDANTGAGLPPGRYIGLGDKEIEFHYPGGPARYTDATNMPGVLAGSGLTLDIAVRNAVTMLGVEVYDAVRMASNNPARVLGLDNKKGMIQEGYDADLVLLDRELKVVKCWIAGQLKFDAASGRANKPK